ncbi:MAG: PEGA domain-containing protein [Myxococcales bacterium]|nr:PEGA domain-containing protein [Myxococcales bacterium]
MLWSTLPTGPWAWAQPAGSRALGDSTAPLTSPPDGTQTADAAANTPLRVGTRAQAAQLFEQGLSAFQGGEFERARQKYEESYAIAPHPYTLYNLALTYERLLEHERAIATFERFLAQLPAADEAAGSERPADRLQAGLRVLAERAINRLRSQPARVSLSAVPDPVTATVAPLRPDGSVGPVRGRIVTPGILTIPAGAYRLQLQREGYASEEVDFDAHIGQALFISRQLRPLPRQLTITAEPRARLYLDDRFLGETPFAGPIALGNHRLRVERRLYLTQLRPLELSPGVAPLRFHVGLERSGLVDMAIGGMVAGAGLGLMVLRLFLGEEIETLARQEFYKPLAAAALPAALGASVAGLAGWQMPAREAQLLIGSAGWGTIIGFGLGLGAQPQGPLPHVLAVGFGVVGGTLGAAAYRFVQPTSGAIAMFNTTVLWSSIAGALGWAYVISEKPETAFYGHPSTGRSGDGGWILLSTALAGVGVGLATSRLPGLQDLTRGQVALIDLGGLAGGVLGGALGIGIGYGLTGDFNDAVRIAVPATLGGIGAGLISASIGLHVLRKRSLGLGATQRAVSGTSPAPRGSGLSRYLHTRPPTLRFDRDLAGGFALGLDLVGGRF